MGDISSAITRALLEGASRFGVAREQLLVATGLDPAALDDPGARISYDAHRAVWTAAEQLLGDRDLGLHMAEAVPTDRFGLVARTCLTSPDVGTAFANLVRYSRLIRSDIAYTLESSGDRVRFGFRMTAPPWVIPRHVAEWMLAIVWLGIRRGSRAQSALREVRFQHAAPPDAAEHLRIFGAPVSFEQTRNELVFDSGALALPVVESDPQALAALAREASAVLSRLPEVDPFIAALRRVLYDSLASGEVALASVSRALHTSREQLKRDLAVRGTSYRAELRALRVDLARAYLEDRSWTIADVAFVLGYSDTTAFKAAFSSWTGKTPAAYRRLLIERGA
jgi:AraC-like DNA-binding protein